MLTEEILNEVIAERARQKELAFGGNTYRFDEENTPNDWVAYITAYAGRATAKCERNERAKCGFRENMLKVAAIAVAAIEAYDQSQAEWEAVLNDKTS